MTLGERRLGRQRGSGVFHAIGAKRMLEYTIGITQRRDFCGIFSCLFSVSAVHDFAIPPGDD